MFTNVHSGERVVADLEGHEQHVEYLSDAQFTTVAVRLAEKAAEEAQGHAEMFTSLRTVADILLAEQPAASDYKGGGWMTYNAGVAAALADRGNAATEMFERVLRGSAPPDSMLKAAAARMVQLVSDPDRFKTEVRVLIARQRDALKLPATDQLPF